MEYLEALSAIFLAWGIYGLIVASFTESFISPVLPDVILIPLALANPENAIYYGLAATGASVAGGFIGYGIGYKLGTVAVQKMIPAKYEAAFHKQVEQNATWAIFLAALSPIPYKFVSITAGAVRIRLDVFTVASFFGRAKRFMVEGILIYFFGEMALAILNDYSDQILIISVAVIVVLILVILFIKKNKKNNDSALEIEEAE